MNVTKAYLEQVGKTSFKDFSEEDIERAKYRLIDSFGVIVASASGDGNDLAVKLVSDIGGRGDASIFGQKRKVPAHNAAFVNSLIMRSFDFEVVEAQIKDGKSTPTHISGTSVPTALAMAEWKKVSGEKMLTALLLGEDLAARLAGSGLCNPFISPWDNTGLVNGLGAALIAGYIMGLDESGLTNALGIALNQLSGSGGNIFDKVMAFKLPIALAARNGIFSAQLGALGFTGMKDPIAGPGGYYDSFCESHNVDDFLLDLGKIHYAEVVIKPYSACRATHPAIDAAIEIRGKHAPDIAKIAVIRAKIGTRLIGSFVDGDFSGDAPRISAAFNLKYNIASALVNGQIHPMDNTIEKIADPSLQALICKIENIGADGLTGASIEVEMENGEKYRSDVTVGTGDLFKKPLSVEQILGKFYKNTDFSGCISKEAAEEAVAFIMDIEHRDNIQPLIDSIFLC
jgi:2-methylcitrate dehydratase PrpD